jgi:cell division protein FtsL
MKGGIAAMSPFHLLGAKTKTTARKKGRVGKTILVVFALLALISTFFAKTLINHRTVNVGHSISAIKSEIWSLEEEHQKMTVELSHLSEVTRIEKIARSRLGLRPPGPEQIIKKQEQ